MAAARPLVAVQGLDGTAVGQVRRLFPELTAQRFF